MTPVCGLQLMTIPDRGDGGTFTPARVEQDDRTFTVGDPMELPIVRSNL